MIKLGLCSAKKELDILILQISIGYKGYKISKLKDECKSHKIKPKGKKNDIANQIINHYEKEHWFMFNTIFSQNIKSTWIRE